MDSLRGIVRTTQQYTRRNNFTGLKATPPRVIVLPVMKYHLREPIPAVFKEPVGSIAFLTIDSGAVITVKGDEQAYGFVEVDYAGDDVLVFMPDLELRADRVKGEAG